MLLIAHLQEHCFTLLSVKLKYLCLASENFLTRLHCEWLQERRNEQIHSRVWLEPGNICNNLLPFLTFIPSPLLLCSMKETSIQTQARWFFRTLVHPLLSLLAFLIKSLLLATTPHLLIYWPITQWAIWTWTQYQAQVRGLFTSLIAYALNIWSLLNTGRRRPQTRRKQQSPGRARV